MEGLGTMLRAVAQSHERLESFLVDQLAEAGKKNVVLAERVAKLEAKVAELEAATK